MLTPGDDKINKQRAEYAEIMLFLRRHILAFDQNITETFKYMTLFYEYKGKGLCYMHSKDDYVYLGFTGAELKHPKLVAEGRKVIRIFKCFVNKDIDVKSLDTILQKACALIDKKIKA
jgi:hypothetical protein